MNHMNEKQRAMSLVIELNGRVTAKAIMDTIECLEWENEEFLKPDNPVDHQYIVRNAITINRLYDLLTDRKVYYKDFQIIWN